VLADGEVPRLSCGEDEAVFIIRTPREGCALKLRDGRFLDLRIAFYLDAKSDLLKVSTSKYQYQADARGDRWIFRYEYIRTPAPKNPHPQAHLHVRGALTEDCRPKKDMLEKVHFPTRRVAFESIVRLLVEQFDVPCKVSASTWEPALAHTEKAFLHVTREPQPAE
jgi:hypothetical protein